MPVYDVSAVAEAIGIEAKQLDNILSRNNLPGVERQTRGVSRRLSVDAAVTIHLACELAAALRMPIGAALRIADELQRDGQSAMAIGGFAALRVNLPALRIATLARLDGAVESVGRRRRGRPPQPRPHLTDAGG